MLPTYSFTTWPEIKSLSWFPSKQFDEQRQRCDEKSNSYRGNRWSEFWSYGEGTEASCIIRHPLSSGHGDVQLRMQIDYVPLFLSLSLFTCISFSVVSFSNHSRSPLFTLSWPPVSGVRQLWWTELVTVKSATERREWVLTDKYPVIYFYNYLCQSIPILV